MAQPTQPLGNPLNDPIPESNAHFWLAIGVLAAYFLLALIWNHSTSHLAEKEVDGVLHTFGQLANSAWIWYFATRAKN